MTFTSRQLWRAYGLLEWDHTTLSERSGVDISVIRQAEASDFQKGVTLFQAGLIQQAFERAGVRFGRNGAVMRAAE